MEIINWIEEKEAPLIAYYNNQRYSSIPVYCPAYKFVMWPIVK